MLRSGPNTPNQNKIQSAQKQTPNKNKNKRKSLPPNLANGGDDSPKKQKIGPFSGTSDLFMQMKQSPDIEDKKAKKAKGGNENKTPAKGGNENKTPAKGGNESKTPAKGGSENKTPAKRDQKQGNDNKASPAVPTGIRDQRRQEKLKTKRSQGKLKLKQTMTQASSGDEAAITRIKENVTRLLQQEKFTSSSKRRLRILKKVLKAAGVDMTPFDKPTVAIQMANKVEKKQGKVQQQKPKGAQQQKDANTLSKKMKKQGVAQQQVKVEEPEVTDEDESEEEESDDQEEDDDSENDNKLIETESIEDDGDDDDDDDDDNVEEEEDDDDGSDDDESDTEVPATKAKGNKKQNGKAGQNQAGETVSSLLTGKSRYVVFVGNIPFDVTKEEISQHFAKIGVPRDVRIPLDRQTSKCRGFAYVELSDQASYEKALSLHHTNLKGRRINVLYSQGGKKKGDDKKKEIKAKNYKLQAMRQEGKLIGSNNASQKRAARREKSRSANNAN